MSNYAKNTAVPIDRSMNQIRIMLQKEGCEAVAIAEAGNRAMVQFVFESMSYKFHIDYPTDKDLEIKCTPAGKERSPSQIVQEIDKEKRRLWRSMNLYIKAAIEAHQNGIINLKRSLMGNIVLESGQTLYGKLEKEMSLLIVDPNLLLE